MISIFLVCATKYSILSGSFIYSILCLSLFISFLFSLVWSEGSLYRVFFTKNILINLSLSFALALGLYTFGNLEFLFYLTEFYTFNLFEHEALNFFLTLLVMFSFIKGLFKMKKSIMISSFVLFFSFTTEAKNINEFLDNIVQRPIVEKSNFLSRNGLTRSFLLPSLPIHCHKQDRKSNIFTFVGMSQNKQGLKLSLNILTEKRINELCLDILISSITEIAKDSSSFKHNFDDHIKDGGHISVDLLFASEKINKSVLANLKSIQSTNSGFNRSIAGLFLILGLIFFLLDMKYSKILTKFKG